MPSIRNKAPKLPQVTTPSASPAKSTSRSSNMPPVPAPRDTFIPGTNIKVPAPTNTTPVVARPPVKLDVTGSVKFGGDFSQSVDGQLVAGGKLKLDYDLSRLSDLRHTHNGHPAWGVTAYVMFNPSGTIAEGAVMEFESNYGRPTNNLRAKSLTVDIPEGTTEVQVWFKNWTGADSQREAWDSNFGRNYRFPVSKPTGAAQ